MEELQINSVESVSVKLSSDTSAEDKELAIIIMKSRFDLFKSKSLKIYKSRVLDTAIQ